MKLKVYIGLGIFLLIILISNWSSAPSLKNEIDYDLEPDISEVYGELQNDIVHLLSRDEDHIHPSNTEGSIIDKATQKIKNAQKDKPTNFLLAKDLIHINYFHNAAVAASECKRMLKYNPNDVFMLVHLAHLQALKKNYKEAIINITKSINIKPSDEAYYILAYCYYYLGDIHKAKSEVEKVSPSSSAYHDALPLITKINQKLSK